MYYYSIIYYIPYAALYVPVTVFITGNLKAFTELFWGSFHLFAGVE